MSTSNHATTTASTSNFTAIFQTAFDEYKRHTGQDPNTHPFYMELDDCNHPDDVLKVLRKQAQAFARFREGDEKLLES
jgi:hypothetical protein